MLYQLYYFGQYFKDIISAGDNIWVTYGSGAGTMLAQFEETFGGPPTGRLTPFNGRLLFSAPDTTGDSNTISELWLADASQAAQVGDGSHSYFPGYITDVDGKAFFINTLGGDWQPFVTDGTVSGTHQLATVTADNAGVYSITDVDGEAFFFAQHGTTIDVWKSDGTAGGTSLVTSVTGAAGTQSGPESGNLGQFSDQRGQIEFKGQFFFGTANGSSYTLTKTDGTTVTSIPLNPINGHNIGQPTELTPINISLPFTNANNDNIQLLIFTGSTGYVMASTGDTVFAINASFGLNGSVAADDIVVSGNRVFFAGRDEATNHSALWIITNVGFGWDTSIVTEAVSGIHDITDMGGGTVFFVASNATHGSELWKYETDQDGFGTTSMVSDISSGSAGSDPHNLIDVGGTLYFEATINGGTSYQLWKSDGTDAGTVPVSPQDVEERIPLAFTPDLVTLTRPTDLNGDLHSDIITVNGEGAVIATELDGTQIVGRSTLLTLSGSAVALLGTGDFDGDGNVDLLIGNTSGDVNNTVNTVSIAHVVDGQVVSTNTIGTLAAQIKWQFQGIGDFNGDGVADVLWRDNADEGGSGHFIVWIVGGGGTVVSPHGEDPNIGTPTLTANFVATGDFNGDGRSDILLNDQGVLETWEMNGTTITGGGTIGPVPNGMTVLGVGDFNGDGHADILFVDSAGSYTTWDISGSSVVSSGVIGSPGGGLTFSAIGDYNGDGKSDILFKSAINSDSSLIWELNDRSIIKSDFVGAGPTDNGPFGDFDNDGHADVLWRNADGVVATWQIAGNGSIQANFVGGVGSDWHIVGVGDLDGNGHDDIVWQNDDGSVLAWLMLSSSAVSSTVGLDPGPVHDSFAGVADVDGDGKGDLLWRNDITGAVTVRTEAGASADITGVGQDWSLIGLGDFNGDGKDDVLFRQNSDGTSAYWQMNGTTVTTTNFLPGVPASWHVVGTGNFDGDPNGTTDVFWHNDNGANAVWFMGIAGDVASAFFFDGVGSDWHVVGTGDVNNDGKADVMWRSDDGSTAIWEMHGAAAPTVVFPGGVTADWQTQAHHFDYV